MSNGKDGPTFGLRLLSSSSALEAFFSGLGGAAAAFSFFFSSCCLCFCLFFNSDLETLSPVTSSRCRFAVSCASEVFASAMLEDSQSIVLSRLEKKSGVSCVVKQSLLESLGPLVGWDFV